MILMNFQKYISFKTKLQKYRNRFIHYFWNGNNYVHLHQKPYIIRFYQYNFLFVVWKKVGEDKQLNYKIVFICKQNL